MGEIPSTDRANQRVGVPSEGAEASLEPEASLELEASEEAEESEEPEASITPA